MSVVEGLRFIWFPLFLDHKCVGIEEPVTLISRMISFLISYSFLLFCHVCTSACNFFFLVFLFQLVCRSERDLEFCFKIDLLVFALLVFIAFVWAFFFFSVVVSRLLFVVVRRLLIEVAWAVCQPRY